MAGGHGYGDDGGELRSVLCARWKQRREWGPGGERGGAGGEGVSVASRGGRGGSRRWLGVEAGGGRGSVGERHASPLLVLLAEEEEDKGGGGGLGRLGELGRLWWLRG